MAPRAKFPQVITANRLLDGEVVYLAGDRSWTPIFRHAQIFDQDQDAQAALDGCQKDVADRLIIDPYLFEVEGDGGAALPRSVRERIRALGPSVRSDLGKQADAAQAALAISL